MSDIIHQNSDEWVMRAAPLTDVVISSRARIARNLPHIPFAPHATDEQLIYVGKKIRAAFSNSDILSTLHVVPISDLPAGDRTYLRESHLISSELERGGTGRWVFLSPAMDTSVMINEEDHIRASIMASGFQIFTVHERLNQLETQIEEILEVAYHPDFGYLTACPTNTGTGLRLSVMLHLPALVMTGQIEETLSGLNSYGLIVRGAYGEHSENAGDLYQISNEVTLGKSEQDISKVLDRIVRQIVDREHLAREALFREAPLKIEDAICRAIGVLAMTRQIDSLEAITLLSRVRLAIGRSMGIHLSHMELSRLFIDIQPAHLQYHHTAGPTPENRDLARATLLRSIFSSNGHHG